MRGSRIYPMIAMIAAVVLLFSACGADIGTITEPDLSTAKGRLQHEGKSAAGGGVVNIWQHKEDLTEEGLTSLFEEARLSEVADYEIYKKQDYDYGAVVSFTDGETIAIINRAIEGDAAAIEEFKEMVAYFEEIAGLIDERYNGRFLIRVYSPEVEDLLFRLFSKQAVVEIIDGIDAFSQK